MDLDTKSLLRWIVKEQAWTRVECHRMASLQGKNVPFQSKHYSRGFHYDSVTFVEFVSFAIF